MTFQYTADYYYDLLRKQTAYGQDIAERRWNFLSGLPVKTVLDYGTGVGFFKAFAPSDKWVDTYDIGPFAQTGIRRSQYDLITMWDVLEHVPDFDVLKPYFNYAKYVAVSVPIVPVGQELKKWKHFRPGEHLHNFTHETLDRVFNYFNYVREKSGYPECPPREDIGTFLYRRVTNGF